MGTGIINKHEIIVWAIRRSGHHVVINWLASMFKGRVFFHNNVRAFNSIYAKNPHIRGKEIVQLFWPTWFIEDKKIAVALFPKIRKDCLLYNHENKDIKKYGNKSIYSDEVVGKSGKKYTVLIMRDFRNLVASLLKGIPPGGKDRQLSKFSRIHFPQYKINAMEFLGETNYLPFTKIFIFFDIWVSSKEYREKKAEELGLINNDYILDYMANFKRRGSHFDNFYEYYDKAKEMNVLERWKLFTNDPDYKEIMKKHNDLVELSKKIQSIEREKYL